MLDLDAEPMAINSALHASFPHGDGLRVPGTVDGFELAVRAVLGQQITVAAARTLGTRLVQAFGEPIETPIAGLDRLFPTPAAHRRRRAATRWASSASCGSGRRRLQALAREVACRPARAARRRRRARHARRAAGPARHRRLDRAVHRDACAALARCLSGRRRRAAEGARRARRAPAAEASQAWRPWRSYAVLRAWHSPRRAARRNRRGTARHILTDYAMKFKNTTHLQHPHRQPARRHHAGRHRQRPGRRLVRPAAPLARHAAAGRRDAEHPVLREAAAQLADYFAGQREHFDLPLDLSHGTALPAGRVAGAAAPSRAGRHHQLRRA